MTLDEKKKKKRKKKHCDSITYTTGNPMLNDYFFNKIHGTSEDDTQLKDLTDEITDALTGGTSDTSDSVGSGELGIGGADSGAMGESLITEAKREVRRYFIRPQNIFCANKAEIIKALIDIGDQNCSVYTLKYLGPEKDINKLTTKDIIYYYDNEILYDKNHVKVMDYDLYIKHEEERQKFSGDIEDVPEEKFNDEYEDRIHQDTVLEDADMPLDLNFELTEDKQKYVCCICGEPSEGYGNNPDPYKNAGRCCDACNLKFVIPARLTQYRDEYSWPGLDDYFDEVDD